MSLTLPHGVASKLHPPTRSHCGSISTCAQYRMQAVFSLTTDVFNINTQRLCPQSLCDSTLAGDNPPNTHSRITRAKCCDRCIDRSVSHLSKWNENRCEVLDYLLLCRTKPDLAEEDVYEAYSEIMGLMYAVPKIVVGFTGPISSVRNVNSETDEQATPFRHAMHFRLADRKAAEAFMENPVKVKAFEDHLRGITDGFIEIAFAGSVRKDMDATFRRTDGWDIGAEHITLVAANTASEAGSSGEQVDEYTQLLTQVAESSVAGSMQSVAGEIVLSAGDSEGGLDVLGGLSATPSHVVMSRFATVEEADAYAVLPPSEALRQGDPRSPATSVLELVFEILPVAGSETGLV